MSMTAVESGPWMTRGRSYQVVVSGHIGSTVAASIERLGLELVAVRSALDDESDGAQG